MDEPGTYPLVYGQGDFTITSAGTYVGDWVTNLDGMVSMGAQIDFRMGTGGDHVRAYLQTSLDDGATVIDIACLVFTTTAARKVLNFSTGAGVAAFTPSDAALADDTVVNGVLGDRVRLKLVTLGAYQNTVLAGRIVAR